MPKMSERRCLCCGQKVSESEWCMETRDGDHRPQLDEEVREKVAQEIEAFVRTPPGVIPSEVTKAYMRAAEVARGGAVECEQCGTLFDPVRSRWLCPSCKWKMSCCEGEPA